MGWKTLNYTLTLIDGGVFLAYHSINGLGDLTPDNLINGDPIESITVGDASLDYSVTLQMVSRAEIEGIPSLTMLIGPEQVTMAWTGAPDNTYRAYAGSGMWDFMSTQIDNPVPMTLRYWDADAVITWGDLLVSDGRTLLDHLKAYLGITDSTDDAALYAALDTAGPIIEVYLDRVIAKREVTEYFPHHFGTVVLHEPQVDVSAGVTVLLNGDEQSDYDVWLDRGKAGHLSRTRQPRDVPMDWRNYDQVDVVYVAGFDPIPVDVATAISWTAALFYQSNGSGNIPGGGGGSGEVKSMTIYDVGSISYDVGSSSSGGGSGYFGSTGVIPESAAQMLMRYKRLSA